MSPSLEKTMRFALRVRLSFLLRRGLLRQGFLDWRFSFRFATLRRFR